MDNTVPPAEMSAPYRRSRRAIPKVVKRAIYVVAGVYLLTVLYFVLMAGGSTEGILMTADHVQVFSLQSHNDIHPPAKYKLPNNRIDCWNIIGQSKPQGAWFARRLSFATLDPFTSLSLVFACFQPAVCFRAWHGASYVDVVVCFHCARFYLEDHDANGHVSKPAEFPMSLLASFQLMALAREALPNDQRLNPRS